MNTIEEYVVEPSSDILNVVAVVVDMDVEVDEDEDENNSEKGAIMYLLSITKRTIMYPHMHPKRVT